jgi:S1-C subfamily serine protease
MRALLAGALGGAVVSVAAIGARAASGLLASATTRTTVIRPAAGATVPVPSQRRESSAQAIYAHAAPAVVAISSSGVSATQSASEYLKGEGGGEGSATGSGFEIDRRGDVLTTWHVIRGASRITVSIGSPARVLEASVIGKDPAHDLALLRVSAAGNALHPVVLGRSDAAQIGEAVFAIGNPFGYERTLTGGMISALGRRIQAPSGAMIQGAIQTDTPIDPGSSGGPLLNLRGQVIGINSQIVTSGGSGGYVGISFAIPIDAARQDLREWGLGL